LENQPKRIKPHSEKQDIGIFSDKPIVICATGIQWGKTTAGSLQMFRAMHRHTDETDNFLVVAPTYKIMQQSTLPEFLRVFEGCGSYQKGDAVFNMHGGGTCYFRTGTDADSIVGVTNVRLIWGDEAGKFSLYFWENMQARAAFRKAQIILTTSPYSLNWMYKEYIRPIMKDPGSMPNVELVMAASNENPYFPEDYFEEKKRTMDPRRFQMMFGGQWNRLQGLVYSCFNEEANVVEPMSFPPGTKFYAGIDWGTTHPFVMHIRAIFPDGLQYQVGEHYETGLTISDMVDIAIQKVKLYGKIELFYCDPSAPGYILEFCRAGLSAVGAENDIRTGIDRNVELIKSGRLSFFGRGMCKHTIDEMEMYRWPDDDDTKGPNVDVKERNPVKQNDHAMDAMRYCSMALYRKTDLIPTSQSDTLINNKIKANETSQQIYNRIRLPTVQNTYEDFS